jgi:hypothetical protein
MILGIKASVTLPSLSNAVFRAVSGLELGFSAPFWDSSKFLELFHQHPPSLVVFSVELRGLSRRFVPFLGQHSLFSPLFQPKYCIFQGSTGLKLGFFSLVSGQQPFLGFFTFFTTNALLFLVISGFSSKFEGFFLHISALLRQRTISFPPFRPKFTVVFSEIVLVLCGFLLIFRIFSEDLHLWHYNCTPKSSKFIFLGPLAGGLPLIFNLEDHLAAEFSGLFN